ncbi:MAG: alanine--tRNA ligase-related protein, partial [Patescibacteria group bacterium]
MTSPEIRQKFLDFFAKRGHAILPSASLVPSNDPSVLF